jgi:hypothetical protein
VLTQTRLLRGGFASRLKNAGSLLPHLPQKREMTSCLLSRAVLSFLNCGGIVASFGYKMTAALAPRRCIFFYFIFHKIWYLRGLKAGIPRYRDRTFIGRGLASRSVKAYAWKKVGVCSSVIGNGTKSFLCWKCVSSDVMHV